MDISIPPNSLSKPEAVLQFSSLSTSEVRVLNWTVGKRQTHKPSFLSISDTTLRSRLPSDQLTAVAVTSSLGSITLLEQLTEFRETFDLADETFIIKFKYIQLEKTLRVTSVWKGLHGALKVS